MAFAGWPTGRVTLCTGAGVLLLALLAGPPTAPAHAAPEVVPTAAAECPAPVPLETVVPGMTGEGLTVVRGSTPEPFQVEVLGVLAGGIGAGRDMIMIKVSDVEGGHVIDQGGGIWAGMSGSPVYVAGRLLGAVSYGFTSAPSPIGGLTPAADMLDLLALGGSTTAARTDRPDPARRDVAVSIAARRDLATRAGTATPRGSLEQLATPLAISGVGSRRIHRVQAAADAAGMSVRAYAAGRTAAPAAPAARLQAGGNFSAGLSYGDITMAYVGTTTAVCGDQALAFGHPMTVRGPAHYGAGDATALAIVEDKTLGSVKMANVGAPFATVDQDRFAGLRADLAAAPAMADVTTVIHNRDTGKSRTGTTAVADPASLPGLLVPAVWANYDAAFDEWGDGIASSQWTITGTRGGGRPFSLRRANQWAARDDITIEPAEDVANAANALLHNEFEDVSIDSVTFGSTVSTRYQQLRITKLAVSVNGHKFTSAKRLRVKVGARLRIRVGLRPYHATTTTTTTTLRLTVPKQARGQTAELSAVGGVELAGAEEDLDLTCLLFGHCAAPKGSLDSVLKAIASTPRNDAVVAQLVLASDREDRPHPVASTTRLQKLTVVGSRSVVLSVRR